MRVSLEQSDRVSFGVRKVRREPKASVPDRGLLLEDPAPVLLDRAGHSVDVVDPNRDDGDLHECLATEQPSVDRPAFGGYPVFVR